MLLQPTLRSTEATNNGLPLAWFILIILLAALAYTGFATWQATQGRRLFSLPLQLAWLIPALSLIGLGIAAYLSYVEILAAPVLCGPVGDCNAVQSSQYAQLFGIPIGVIGLLGYTLILVAWVWSHRTAPLSDQMPLIIFCAALFSVLFSTYLTILEIFVIGAVCIWCLTSALIVSLILCLSVQPMLRAGAWLEESSDLAKS
jgi:uncharacterized membrane protein